MRQRTGTTSSRHPANLPPRSSCWREKQSIGGTGMPALSIPSSLRVYVLVFGASLWSKTQLHHHKLRLCLLAGAVGAQLPNTDMAGGSGAHQGLRPWPRGFSCSCSAGTGLSCCGRAVPAHPRCWGAWSWQQHRAGASPARAGAGTSVPGTGCGRSAAPTELIPGVS